MNRARCWSNLPRAAATLLALLLSVLAGPRGNADDRRADGSRGEVAQVAPIHPLEARVVQHTRVRAPVCLTVALVSTGCVPVAHQRMTARPLRGTPVAARAP